MTSVHVSKSSPQQAAAGYHQTHNHAQPRLSASSMSPPHTNAERTREISHVDRLIQRAEGGLFTASGVTGVRQVSHAGPVYGTSARRVEVIDGTTPRFQTTLQDARFRINVASRSDSVSEVAFPEGAVEIEQHYYRGDVLQEEYGTVNEREYDAPVIRDIPVYRKEIDEVIKCQSVVNTIVERVPKFNYIDEVVEVERIVEKPVYREIPVKKTVVKQVPKQVHEKRLIEKVRYLPVTEEVEVERIVEIPGEIIVQPRHVVRDEYIYSDKHLDKEVPVVISQVINPILKDTKKKVRVPARVLTPDLSTTNISVPKPVDIEFHQSEVKTKLNFHKLSAADYNSAFFQLNAHLSHDHRQALKAGNHIHIESDSGYPVMRDRNLKFYRLPEEDIHRIEGFVLPKVAKSKSSSTSVSSVSSSDKRHVTKPGSKTSEHKGMDLDTNSTYARPLNGSVSVYSGHAASKVRTTNNHTPNMGHQYVTHSHGHPTVAIKTNPATTVTVMN